MAALFLLLIYSIGEELSLHGLFHRSGCFGLFVSCFLVFLFGQPFSIQRWTERGPGVLPSRVVGRQTSLPLPLPLGVPFLPAIPGGCRVGVMGERQWLKVTSPTPNQTLTFYGGLQWQTRMTCGKNTGFGWESILIFFKPTLTGDSVLHDEKL